MQNNTPNLEVEIKPDCIITMHSRLIPLVMLRTFDGKVVFNGAIADALKWVQSHNAKVVNAEEALNTLVLQQGFGA